MKLRRREPFFLRGRRSVLLRAVLMTTVLAGLASVAGICVTLAFIQTPAYQDLAASYIIVPGVWSVCATVLVNGPLNFWNGRSWYRIAGTLPVAFATMLIFMTCSLGGYETPKISVLLGLALMLLVNGLFLLRASRLHGIAWLISVIGAVVPERVFEILRNHAMPLHTPGWLADYVFYSALFGSFYFPLAIPWGLPFWWPPESGEAVPDRR